ncbi:plasmid pRiA4b ORF-3 family protein [Methanobrevibacter millerae]|uniref:PRiA4b ORF-3-like protein n=1 Tax=Methanobrevibacter millerae TaxID=230361 RepID=A0A1G5VHM1_9EURY|nr:plasmid pRiA4b ORF-3 family protein [Methanobrevibacter millerae]SDA45264.1 pRiA4b ORF-3-like protein [Methanobrevibacter millerae]
MSGYEIRLMLYSNIETSRTVQIPKSINFKQLHMLIQKIFGFKDYHNYEFQIPREIPGEDAVDLNSIKRTIGYEDTQSVIISEVFDEDEVVLYVYDFGDNWEIVVHKQKDIDYTNKTALITDYKGKYNPLEDMGGIFVFEEIVEAIEENENLKYVLDEYCLTKGDLAKMDFERKYKVGSRLRI